MKDADTIALLEECNSGCKMATDSMEQVRPYITDERLLAVVGKYDKKHIELGDKAHKILNSLGEEEKDPGKMAKAFSWFTVEMKLMMKSDTKQIVKMLMDGCNMGIQSISENVNKYTEASLESKSLANDLVLMEEEFMKSLKEYL